MRHTGSSARVYEYREAMPVEGSHAIPSIGTTPIEATNQMKAIAAGEHSDGALESAGFAWARGRSRSERPGSGAIRGDRRTRAACYR